MPSEESAAAPTSSKPAQSTPTSRDNPRPNSLRCSVSLNAAEQAVREGDLDGALRDLQDQVRKAPEKAELRVFLFQLLSAMGDWGRARAQLDVAAELDARTLAMAQMYREALHCERLRSDVFAGKRSPMIFG